MSFVNPSGGRPLNVLFEDIDLNYRQVFEFAVENFPSVVSQSCKLMNQVAAVENRLSGNFKVEVYRYGIKYPFASIATGGRATSGSNLVLTLAETDFDGFRLNSKLRSKSGARGTVIASAPGTVTIKPFPTSYTFTSSDFVAQEIVGYEGILTQRDGGDSVERLVYLPLPEYNLIEQQRETAYLYADEAWQETWLSAGSGQKYYARQSQLDAMENLMKTVCKRMYTGSRIQDSDTTVMSGGIPWQIQNQGGTYLPFYSTLTETEYQNMIAQANKKGGLKSTEITQLWGFGYATMFGNNVGKQYVTTAGEYNVVGGAKVSGLNITEYGYGAYKVNGIKETYFDTPGIFEEEGFSTVNSQRVRSNYSIALDTTPAKTDGGYKPWIMKYHFGPEGMIRARRDGLTDINGMPSTNPTSGKLVGIEDYHYNCLYQLTQPTAHVVHFLAV